MKKLYILAIISSFAFATSGKAGKGSMQCQYKNKQLCEGKATTSNSK
jgi:hypothetical protein